MVDVTDDDCEQAEEEDDTCSVNDWMQRLDGWRELFDSVQVLKQRNMEKLQLSFTLNMNPRGYSSTNYQWPLEGETIV